MSVHIGQIIARHLSEHGITKKHLAEQINRSRDYVYKMLERPYISTEDLFSISQALEHNFFWYFTEKLMDFSPTASLGVGVDQNNLQIVELQKERGYYKKENAYLKEINQLLREKLDMQGGED